MGLESALPLFFSHGCRTDQAHLQLGEQAGVAGARRRIQPAEDERTRAHFQPPPGSCLHPVLRVWTTRHRAAVALVGSIAFRYFAVHSAPSLRFRSTTNL